MGLQVSQSMLSAEHSRALRAALVTQRNGHEGKQGVEEPLPGVQPLTGTVAHSDVFAPPFPSPVLWEPLWVCPGEEVGAAPQVCAADFRAQSQVFHFPTDMSSSPGATAGAKMD